jgi:hypothetical protein
MSVFEAIRDGVLALVRQPWFLVLAFPAAQPFITIGFKRLARKRRLEVADLAVGAELLITALGLGLAGLRELDTLNDDDGVTKALWLVGVTVALLFITSVLVRELHLQANQKDPTGRAVVTSGLLGGIFVSYAFLLLSDWGAT